MICLYWIGLLVVCIPLASYLTITQSYIPQICLRKFFHILTCLMFAPIIEYDLEFLSLSFAVALCGLLLIEFIRLSFLE